MTNFGGLTDKIRVYLTDKNGLGRKGTKRGMIEKAL